MLVPSGGLGLGGGAGGKVQDRRMLMEKSTQVKLAKKVVNYLAQRGYPNAVSAKTLDKITTKEYFSIVKFLYNQIDPYFQYSAKPEDDFFMILRVLKYQPVIKKSDLSTSVAAPMAWPHFLGFLAWFVELLLYDEVAASKVTPEGLGRDGDQTEKQFMDFLGKAYQGYLNGSDDFTALEEELTMALRERGRAVEEDIQSLESDIMQLQENLEPLKAEQNRLELHEKKKAEFLSDVQKFEHVIAELGTYKAALEKKIKEQQGEIQMQDAEYDKYTQEKTQCLAIIEEQDLNNIDADRIAKEKAQLEEAQIHASSLRLTAEQNAWEVETRLNKRQEELEKAIATFNSLATELSIVPSTAKYAEGRDLAIEFQPSTQSISLDVDAAIKPLVKNLKEKFAASFRKSQEQLLDLHEKKERAEESLKDRLEEQKTLQNKHKALQAQIQAQKEEAESEIRHLQEEADQVLREVQRLKQLSQSSVNQSQKSWQTIEEQYEELQARYTQEKNDLCVFMLSMVDMLVSHKAFVQDQLLSLSDRFQQERTKLLAVGKGAAATSTAPTVAAPTSTISE